MLWPIFSVCFNYTSSKWLIFQIEINKKHNIWKIYHSWFGTNDNKTSVIERKQNHKFCIIDTAFIRSFTCMLNFVISWIQCPNNEINNKTASFQKEAMRTQVALWFFMKWNLYREVPLYLSKQNVWTYTVKKGYCFKRLWSERNDWIWLHLFYIWRDMSFVTYHPSNKQLGHFIGRETVYCNLNSNVVEGMGCPVLAAW